MEFLKSIWAAIVAFGPAAVFVVGFLDSIGIPLVGGVDALLLGIGASTPHLAYFAATLATIGSVLGNLVLFRAAYYGGRKFARESMPEDSKRAKFQRWFHRYGLLTVFIPAVTPFVPLPLKVFVVSAGAMHTPWRRFIGVVLLARVIRYYGEAYLGIQLGRGAADFLRHNVWNIVGIFLALALVLIALIKWQDRRRLEA